MAPKRFSEKKDRTLEAPVAIVTGIAAPVESLVKLCQATRMVD